MIDAGREAQSRFGQSGDLRTQPGLDGLLSAIYRAMIAAAPKPDHVVDVADMIPSEWRPIATAPRDGTRFLAYEDGNHYALEWCPETPRGGYWKCFCGQYVTLTPEPSHWMPLPIPPADSEPTHWREHNPPETVK